MKFLRFLLSRVFVCICVIYLGTTIIFIVPRLLPSDPVDAMMAQMMAQSSFMEPQAIELIRQSLTESFGLEGSTGSQYVSFLKRVVLTRDFGPSFSQYPVPVSELVSRALPWTMGLLLTTTFISWVLGNTVGLIAGFRKEKTYSKILEGIAIVLYPIPYYVFALILIILFAYIFPVFPLATSIRGSGFNLNHIRSIIWNSLLPASSMIMLGLGWWVISMKTLVGNVAEEEYVYFARYKGLSERKIMTGYVLPNAALPQVTMLALQIGRVFGGALVTEMLFSYPGIGMLIYSGIVQNDYNLIMGGISITIVAVALATLLVDLIYPFLDPRVRYT